MRTCFGILGFGLLLVVSACAASGMTISDAKLLPDNSSVSLPAKVVTYAAADFFYIEEDSRCMGIRVEKTAHGLTVGMRADVSGDMKTNDSRERYILATSAAHNGDGVITPVGMNNAALGGADWQVVGTGGQLEVSNSLGLNNIGLLVKTWGQFYYVNATTFTLDDGAGLNVKCTVPSGTFLYTGWQYVSVTGVSSMYKFNDSIYPPEILVRDIQGIPPVADPCEMIYIPAGSFLMGNNGSEPYSYPEELPRHWVNLSAYYIGKYEVTRGQYRAFMDAGGYTNSAYWSTDGWNWKGSNTQPSWYWVDPVNLGTPPGSLIQGDSRPVIGVTYYEAEAFCAWAGGHLPTEAQWERAARWTGTHANVYPWGDTWDAQKSNNWNDTLYPGCQTAPVGSYSSYGSPSGCQDMAGNVWEWCKDWFGGTYYSTSPSSDPQGPASGDNGYRVLRGGGFFMEFIAANGNRSACRNHYPPRYGSSYWGFRLAR